MPGNWNGWQRRWNVGVDFAEIDCYDAFWRRAVQIGKLGAKDDVTAGIGKANVNGLRKRFVHGGKGNEDLDIGVEEFCLGAGEEGAAGVDGMNDDPLGGQESDVVALQRELVEAANGAIRIGKLHPAIGHSHFQIQKLTLPAVRDAKHETSAVPIWRDQSDVAADDVGRWTRKTSEQDAGDQSEAHQAGQGFDGDEGVGECALWRHLAVADGGDGLDGEEDRVVPGGSRFAALDGARAGRDVKCREKGIGDHIENEGIQEE